MTEIINRRAPFIIDKDSAEYIARSFYKHLVFREAHFLVSKFTCERNIKLEFHVSTHYRVRKFFEFNDESTIVYEQIENELSELCRISNGHRSDDERNEKLFAALFGIVA